MGKASEYRNRRARRQATTEVELPSGAVFTLRRPPLDVWIAAGRVPQSFLLQAIKVKQGSAPESLSDDETIASIVFIRDALLYACVSPKLVNGATGDDELDPGDLDPEDFDFLSRWVLSGSPGVRVQTEGGETSIESLSRFRQKRAGGKPFSLEPDGGEVQPETERVVGYP